jgi:siderophore synthetase component
MYDASRPQICSTHLVALVKKFGQLPEVDEEENWWLLREIWDHRENLFALRSVHPERYEAAE